MGGKWSGLGSGAEELWKVLPGGWEGSEGITETDLLSWRTDRWMGHSHEASHLSPLPPTPI